MAGRAKVEAPVQFAATSIRVELSCFGEVKELLGDYVMNEVQDSPLSQS